MPHRPSSLCWSSEPFTALLVRRRVRRPWSCVCRSVVKDQGPEGPGAGSGLGFPLRPEPHAPSITVGNIRVMADGNAILHRAPRPGARTRRSSTEGIKKAHRLSMRHRHLVKSKQTSVKSLQISCTGDQSGRAISAPQPPAADLPRPFQRPPRNSRFAGRTGNHIKYRLIPIVC